MIRPGEIAPFNRLPQVAPGVVGPLEWNPIASIETPEIQHLGVGNLTTFRSWGLPPGQIPPGLAFKPPEQWPEPVPWGMGHQSPQLDEFAKYIEPTQSPEVLRPFDMLRCVELLASSIIPAGLAMEIVNYEIPQSAAGIVERVPTILRVTALDDDGETPIYTYGDLNGSRPCVRELVHPDPEVTEPLTWTWRLTLSHVAAVDLIGFANYVGPTFPAGVRGRDVIPPWNDLRYGINAPWGDTQQIPVPPGCLVRLWVIVYGPPNRFLVEVGGRIAGYWQSCGRAGRALHAATVRER